MIKTIKVKPEGREGVWIPKRESLLRFLANYEFDKIHCLRQSVAMAIGADWQQEDVIDFVKESDRVAVLTGSALANNRGHALSVIVDGKLFMFDIGNLTESDLTIEE